MPSMKLPAKHALGRDGYGHPAVLRFRDTASKDRYKENRRPEEKYYRSKTPTASQDGQPMSQNGRHIR